MIELIKDRKQTPVFENDFVLYGVRCNSMGDPGEMRVGRVLGKNGYGVEVEGSSKRFKAGHFLTKVDEDFAIQFKKYTE